MLKVYGEHYVNDWNRHDVAYEFANLKELEEWLFDQPKQYHYMYFPICKEYSHYPITVQLAEWSTLLWIHRIDSENGIIFSDGVKGKKYWSKEVEEWCKHCDKRVSIQFYS